MFCLWLRFSAYRTRNAAICVCWPLLNPSSDCLELGNWKRRTVGLCAGRHIEGHDANRFFARSNPRSLGLTIQHFYRRLLFDLEFGGLLITQLRVLTNRIRIASDRTPSNWYTCGVSMVYGSVPWLQTV